MPDSTGQWSGIDTDVCRALAAGMFGDKNKVTFVALSPQQRFTALQSGEVDLLSRNTTWSLSRDTAAGLNFGPVVFYDGQAFMAPKSLGVSSAKELNGATICVQPGTTTEQNLADYFRRNQMTFQPVVIEAFDEINAAFFAGRCDGYTTDASGLAGVRSTLASNPDDYVILPELVSQEPLAPAVAHGDDQWFDYLKWTVYALIQAEQLGLDLGQCGSAHERSRSQYPAPARHIGRCRGHARGRCQMGLQHRQAGRELRRAVRAEPRQKLGT